METLFVPEDFRVPQRIQQPNYILRPLTTADVEKDYEAVMSSTQSLRQIFSQHDDWPDEHMTLQDNERDLARHQADFEQRRGFTYTVETPEGNTCLGCVYIYPAKWGNYDARVYCWVRDSVKAQGIEDQLGAFLRNWLREEWPFQQLVFPGRDISWQEWQALKSSVA
jgi:hypothetical protein